MALLQHLQTFLWLKCLCEAMGGSIFYFSHSLHLTDQWRMERPRLRRFYFQSALLGWGSSLWIIANIVKISGVSKEGTTEGESICGKGWRISTTGSCLGSMCTCIYNVTVSIIQDSMLLLHQARRSPVSTFTQLRVVIYAPGLLQRQLRCHTGAGGQRTLKVDEPILYGWVASVTAPLVVPRTEWWSRRSALVLSTSGWSSPHKRCPETSPAEPRQALQETRKRSQPPTVSSWFVNVNSSDMVA